MMLFERNPHMNSSIIANRRSFRAARRAFTLIELLLVMVIIAILASIVVPKVISRVGQSKETKAKADLSSIKTALNMFNIDNGRYPTTEEGLRALVVNPDPGSLTKWQKNLDRDDVPKDPWGNDYIYRCPGSNGDDYDLSSTGAPGGQPITPD
jgi:general secretion pathway protein G